MGMFDTIEKYDKLPKLKPNKLKLFQNLFQQDDPSLYVKVINKNFSHYAVL